MDGRTKKFSKETWSIIVDSVRKGMTQARAAQAAGISETTLYDWINKGMNDLERYPQHAEFYRELQIANAQCERDLAQIIIDAAKLDWKAAFAILRARFPKDWGKQTVVHTDWEEYVREHNLDPEKVRNAFSRAITEMVEERQVELGLDNPSGRGQAQAARPPDMDPPPGNTD